MQSLGPIMRVLASGFARRASLPVRCRRFFGAHNGHKWLVGPLSFEENEDPAFITPRRLVKVKDHDRVLLRWAEVYSPEVSLACMEGKNTPRIVRFCLWGDTLSSRERFTLH